MESVPCNICGSHNRISVLTAPDYKYATAGKFSIVRCRDCGLAYLCPRPTETEIAEYYPESVVEHNASSEPNHFATAEADIVLRYQTNPGKILDVGCACGYFLSAMRKHGWRAEGVEPDPGAACRAEASGFSVKRGFLTRTDFNEGEFDSVTFWSVLEHLHDPASALGIVREILKPSGYLYLGLPNFNSIERILFQKRWFGLDIPRHLYHFDPQSIRRILANAGFRVISLGHASGPEIAKWSLHIALGRVPNMVPRGHLTNQSVDCEKREKPLEKIRRAINKVIGDTFIRAADLLGRGNQMLVVAKRE